MVDYSRGLKCEKECAYQGSAYLTNTLILDEVPNSNGTWVAAVTEEDIGTIIMSPEAYPDYEDHLTLKIKAHTAKVTEKNEKPDKAEKNSPHSPRGSPYDDPHELDFYMDDGVWKEGVESAQAFLTEAKGIDQDTAGAIANYLIANPKNVSQYQLEHMSHEDLSLIHI